MIDGGMYIYTKIHLKRTQMVILVPVELEVVEPTPVQVVLVRELAEQGLLEVTLIQMGKAVQLPGQVVVLPQMTRVVVLHLVQEAVLLATVGKVVNSDLTL